MTILVIMLCKASSCRKPSLRAFHGLLGVMRGDIHIWMSASLHHGNARKTFLLLHTSFWKTKKSWMFENLASLWRFFWFKIIQQYNFWSFRFSWWDLSCSKNLDPDAVFVTNLIGNELNLNPHQTSKYVHPGTYFDSPIDLTNFWTKIVTKGFYLN